MRHLAPAGAPIRAGDLARWGAFFLANPHASGELAAACRERFGTRYAFATANGRAGLTLLLRAMRRVSATERDEIVLPSYTCFSVAASIVKAGLRPRIVDISTDTLDFSSEQLRTTDFTRVLAVVATNLYGIPSDLPAICGIARRHGVFVIDDAAQAMGATVGGRPSGTWGDAGLFSFDKGKNVSGIDGGVVVTGSDAIAAAFAEEIDGLAAPGPAASAAGVVKALAYFAMLRPSLYWIPNRIPQLRLGATVFSTDFALEKQSRSLGALGVTMLRHLDEFTAARVRNAAAIIDGLHAVDGVRVPVPPAGARPVYLRLPVLFADQSARTRAMERLNAAGIGASASYPASIVDVPELQHRLAGAPGAAQGRRVARTILTLPTHSFVAASDVARTIDILACAIERNQRPAGAPAA